MTVETNPLLMDLDKLPGFNVTLPSNAAQYNTLIVNQSILDTGEVHVKPMSIRDEMDLKTPDLLISGEGIASVIKRCVSGIIDPMGLTIGDINTLLVALKMVTYGEKMQIEVTNPYYDKELKGSMERLNFTVDLKYCLVNANTITKDDLVIKLNNNQTVKMQQLSYKDTMEFLKFDIVNNVKTLDTDEKKQAYILKKMNNLFMSAIKMIVSVTTSNGMEITDTNHIKEWYEKLHHDVYDDLKVRLDKIASVGPKTELPVTDPITKNSWTIKVPMDPTDFFGNGTKKVI